MSLATIYDRVVELELTAPAGEDARGNEVRGTTERAGIPAYRYQVDTSEDTADRDQQAKTFVYYLPPVVDGEPVVLSGRDRIVDGDETLEVLGQPITATRRGRPHHVEARAFVVSG